MVLQTCVNMGLQTFMCKHRIADICKHTQLFTWVWGSKLRSWCFCGRHLTNQTVSPAARPFLIWDDGSTYWWHLLIEEYACQEGHCNLNLLNRMEFRHVEMSNIICPITTFLGNTSVPNTQKWVVLLEAVARVQVFNPGHRSGPEAAVDSIAAVRGKTEWIVLGCSLPVAKTSHKCLQPGLFI